MSDPDQPGATPATPEASATLATLEQPDGRDALIAKLRDFERRAEPQLKELERLRVEQTKREREKLSDADRVTADLQTAARERDAATATRDVLQAENDALVAEVDAEIKARLKRLPDELQAFVPEDATPALRLSLLRKAEAAAAKLVPATPLASRSTPTGPRGTGGLALAAAGNADAALIEDKRRRIGGL